LIENIIWDVKSYLNYRNNLNDYDLLSVIERDYEFSGIKTFKNKVIANELTASKLTVDFELVNNLNITTCLSIDCNISTTSGKDIVFAGWSYGLVNNDLTNTKINCGSVDNKVGDPVCFVNGRPREISCVNYATNAYKLVGIDGTGWNIGNGAYRTYNNDNLSNNTLY
jgi:hypothetical protein